MSLAICCFRRLPRIGIIGVWALFFWFCAACPPLMAQGADAAPAPGRPAPGGAENFGQYLADHQEELAPFFAKYSDALAKEAMPVILGVLGRIMLLTLLAGWVIDVLLSRCFSAFFAPAYAKLKRAFIYATGRLALSVVVSIFMGLFLGFISGGQDPLVVSVLLVAIFLLVEFAAQIGWVCYLYRTEVFPSAMFYLAIFLVHTTTAILVSSPILGSRAPDVATGFIDQSVTPKVRAEVDAAKHDLAVVGSARDDIKAKVTEVQAQLADAMTQQTELRKEIDEKKNSEGYVYSQIVKVRATGDLAAARTQFTDFLARFPAGSLAGAAQAQLTEVNSEMAAQDAQKKQAEADAARAAAQAQADLLARAGRGEVTLSEMRRVLMGKTPADISALFGPPSETASDRWGYGKQMMVNPLTGEKHGLAIIYADGTVQGVDYYYGGAK